MTFRKKQNYGDKEMRLMTEDNKEPLMSDGNIPGLVGGSASM